MPRGTRAQVPNRHLGHPPAPQSGARRYKGEPERPIGIGGPGGLEIYLTGAEQES